MYFHMQSHPTVSQSFALWLCQRDRVLFFLPGLDTLWPRPGISLDESLHEADSSLHEADALRARSATAHELGERARRVRRMSSTSVRAPPAWRRACASRGAASMMQQPSVVAQRSVDSCRLQHPNTARALVVLELRRQNTIQPCPADAQTAQQSICTAFQ
jgi:hypothetical protein